MEKETSSTQEAPLAEVSINHTNIKDDEGNDTSSDSSDIDAIQENDPASMQRNDDMGSSDEDSVTVDGDEDFSSFIIDASDLDPDEKLL